MKKCIVLLICIIVLCGCTVDQSASTTVNPSIANTPAVDVPQETNDWRIYTSESGTMYTAEKLPYYCPYNDKEFSLKRTEYYTDKIGKSYVLFAIMVLDIRKIPDDELDWFVEDTHHDIFTYMSITNEDNDLDSEKMTPIGIFHYTDAKELLYIYMTPLTKKENRYQFDNCDFSMAVSAEQKEKYEYNGSKYHKRNEISYYDRGVTRSSMKIRFLDYANEGLKEFIIKQVNSLGD